MRLPCVVIETLRKTAYLEAAKFCFNDGDVNNVRSRTIRDLRSLADCRPFAKLLRSLGLEMQLHLRTVETKTENQRKSIRFIDVDNFETNHFKAVQHGTVSLM